ncbi:MAG: 4Fe-4S binding protein [Armatimonadota bacterium]|nr:4Fe-4S binding protein [Armatimonadota bacterium]MDR7444982.1 4Fe-4S binding protein [Armatimonadota bacterium]MDR7570567.1 4Fe-4S binding protein [Armatimonadota bacterium]MDR7615083.1 4Fe-4S binding protein [Armatimonadota bacterium]
MGEPGRALLVICGHRGNRGAPWADLGAVEEIPGACEFPERLVRLLRSHPADRGVLALCGVWALPEDVRVALRGAGKDPEAFFALDPWSGQDSEAGAERAALLIRAALARVRVWPGTVPANLAPYLPERLSRRTLLRFPPVAYRVVPRVERDRCRAADGCAACEGSCPVDALRVAEGRVVLDRTKCTGCAACVEACPHEAVVFPGYMGEEVAAHVEALLDPTVGPPGPRGIVYVCAGVPWDPSWDARWLPVPVACVSSLPVSWILAPLLRGASSVAVAPCACKRGEGARGVLEARLEFCRAYLGGLGLGERRIHGALLSVAPHEEPALPRCGDGEGTLFGTGPEAASRVLRLLADVAGRAAWVEHPASPLGLVEIDAGTCTGCGMCAARCPTDALSFVQDGEAVLRWDPARCTGCGQCTGVCPEIERGAIRARRAVDVAELRRGVRTVYREEVVRCVACGAPVAPRRMLERVTGLLGEDGRAWEEVLSWYCSECRALRGRGVGLEPEAGA